MKQIEQLAKQIAESVRNADYVLIGAGAGMSAAAGISFADEALFASRYAYWKAKGRHSEYSMFRFTDWTETQRWAYFADHVHRVCCEFPKGQAYQDLLAILAEKNYYVITSNVDHQFSYNGFPDNRVFEAQGRYDRLLCSADCSEEDYPFLPHTDAMMAATDQDTWELPESAIPRCPRCGAKLTFAFRDYAAYEAENKAWRDWLKKTESGKLCILEIGVGFNSAGVIRIPIERITGERPSDRVVMYRITADYPNSEEEIAYPEIPKPIADKAFSVNYPAEDVLSAVRYYLENDRKES